MITLCVMVVRVLFQIVIWAPVVGLVLTEPSAAKPSPFANIYRNYLASNPNSCESMYYGLFVDPLGNEKTAFHFDGTNQNPEQWKLVWEKTFPDIDPKFQQIKETLLPEAKKIYQITIFGPIFKAFYDQDSSAQQDPSQFLVTQEWNERMERTTLGIVPKDSNGVGPNGSPENKDPYLNQSSALMKVEVAAPSGVDPLGSPTMNIKDFLGETLYPFPQNWPDPEIQWGLLRFGIESEAANVFLLAHELSHLVDWAPTSLTDCLSSSESIQARLGEKSSDRANQYGGGGLYDGYGAAPSNLREILSEMNNLQEGLQALAKNGVLWEQMGEAVADYYATHIVVEFIGKHYDRQQQKNAALAVLFTLPPEFENQDFANAVSNIYAHKPNELRVLRLILANPKFRELLGCEWQNPIPPVQCRFNPQEQMAESTWWESFKSWIPSRK